MPSTKLQRLLDVIVFLGARRFPVSVEQIMRGVPWYAERYATGEEKDRAAARRAFERDKDELREVGVPVETVEYRVSHGLEEAEGYRLAHRNFYLPYLRLLGRDQADDPLDSPTPPGERPGGTTPDIFEVREVEAEAALEGLDQLSRIPSFPLAAAARSAYRKLTYDLAPDLHPPSTTLYLDPPGGPDPRDTVHELSDATLRRKAVSFRYRGIHRNATTDRRVRPYGLVFRQSRWYLVGHDEMRDDVRVFRVSRMEDVEVNGTRPNTADYEVPDDFDLAAYGDREAWELGSRDDVARRVRVRFRFPRSLWAERNGYGELVDTRKDGATIREFDVQDSDAFLRWLLPQRDEAVIELPGDLRRELTELARRVADVHAEGGG